MVKKVNLHENQEKNDEHMYFLSIYNYDMRNFLI